MVPDLRSQLRRVRAVTAGCQGSRKDARLAKADRVYLEALRRMKPEQRLRKAWELSAMTRELFEHGLRRRHPDLSPEAFARLLQDRLSKCHNRN